MAGQEPHRGGPAVFDDVNKPRYRNYKFGKTADDRDRASILIYIKDIPVNSAFPRAGVLNRLPEPLHRYVNYAPVGLEYHDDGRTSNIYGNDAAQELLTEFDSVIDFGRNGSQLVQTRFTDAFGQDAIRGMNLDEMLSLVILWCHSWFTSRNRFLESSLNSTPGAWQRMPVYRDNQRRTNLANDNLHAPNIEIDALWVCVPSIYTVAPAGRHTRGVTNSCFRNMYRLNRVEALSIMHIAKQKDAIGNSTRYGRIFRWITYFITQYVRWKATVFEQYARMLPHNHLHLTHEERKTYQANQWDQDGGRQIEVDFESLLYWVLEMVRFIQAGLDIPDPVMEQFNRGRQWVYDAIREKRIPARGFRAAVGPIGRIEDRDFAGKTEMNIDSPSFTYQVTVTLPTVRRLGRRGPLKVDQNLCEQIIEIVPSTAAVAIPLAPVDNFSDNPDPSDTHTHAVVAATAQVVSELDDDELSSEDYDEEEEPPYTIEIQDGTALKRSLTAPKGPIARLTTSALLRDALWGAGSLKRPARTPLRSVFSGRADKRPKITDFIEPGSEEE